MCTQLEPLTFPFLHYSHLFNYVEWKSISLQINVDKKVLEVIFLKPACPLF